jgi:hypothetical protein
LYDWKEEGGTYKEDSIALVTCRERIHGLINWLGKNDRLSGAFKCHKRVYNVVNMVHEKHQLIELMKIFFTAAQNVVISFKANRRLMHP